MLAEVPSPETPRRRLPSRSCSWRSPPPRGPSVQPRAGWASFSPRRSPPPAHRAQPGVA